MGIKLHSSLLLIALSATGTSLVHADDVSQARDALTKQESDADAEKALEEVFETEIEDEDAEKLTTVQSAIDYLTEKLG